MKEILKDVKSAVKEMTGEDASNITEVLELLGRKNEGTLKEKVHAAAMELDVSIFVEVCDLLWAQLTTNSPQLFYLHLTRLYFSPPGPRMLCSYKSAEEKVLDLYTRECFDELAVFRPNAAQDDRSWR